MVLSTDPEKSKSPTDHSAFTQSICPVACRMSVTPGEPGRTSRHCAEHEFQTRTGRRVSVSICTFVLVSKNFCTSVSICTFVLVSKALLY